MIADGQTLPDAGTVLQQIQQDRHPALPPKSAPLFLPPPPMESIGGATVTVTAIKFAGNTLLTDRKLSRVVAGFVGRPLTFADLQNAAIAVANTYRSAGWVVKAYLPQQDITGGPVTIQIIEAKFGKVRIEGATKRVSSDRLQNMVDASQQRGKPLNADALDRALLLIDGLPGVTAAGSLVEGESQAETDLRLAVKDAPQVTGHLTADNAGARFTGAGRIFADATLNAPFGLGDRLDAVLLDSRGSDYQRADYSLPVGNDGWRVGVNGSHLSYNIISAAFSALDAHGNSTTAGLEADYPLVRARLGNLFFSANFDDKRFDNESSGAITSRYSIDDVSVSLNGNLFDTLGGGGATSAGITLEQGQDDLAGSPNEGADATTTGAAGSFRKLSFSASRQQRLTDWISLFAGVSGQTANKNLDSSEKFYLGGASGVRAYPANEGGGTQGLLVNLEARARLPSNFNAIGFVDWGTVRINKDEHFAGAPTPNDDTLQGVGISLGWTATFGLSLKATVAHRIGTNPMPTANGDDQDGSLVRTRLWLQVSMPF
jgi:hemolysin activation/secretion protein